MGQCKWCEKKGFFLSINKDGLCKSCTTIIGSTAKRSTIIINESNSIIEKSGKIDVITSRTSVIINLLKEFEKYEKKGIQIFNQGIKETIINTCNESNQRIIEVSQLKFEKAIQKCTNTNNDNTKKNIVAKYISENEVIKNSLNKLGTNYDTCLITLMGWLELLKEKSELNNNELISDVKDSSISSSIGINIETKTAIEKIKQKREKNNERMDFLYKKGIELLHQGKEKESTRILNFDSLEAIAFSKVYNKAVELEKAGFVEKAAKLFWENIYENGSDIPDNFNRLMIILNKLGFREDELKVAEIYLSFVSEPYIEKIKKRIERIKKQLNK